MKETTLVAVAFIVLGFVLASLFWSCAYTARQCTLAGKCWEGGSGSCKPCRSPRGDE